MVDKEKILAALAQLDPLDDDQWTTDGSVKVEIVMSIVGEVVKRQDIVNAAPDFNREKASKGDDDQTGNGEGDGTDGGEGELNAGHDEFENDDVDLPFREMANEEFQAWLQKVPKGELEDVEATLKRQHDAVGLEVKELQELQKRITRAVSVTRNRIKEAFPNSADVHAIRSFIQSQAQARADRVGRRNEILKGISVKDLDPRAPIDAAMSRKNKRGTGRPVRPLMK